MSTAETRLPSHARVVIIGGGIVGCSLAYHLTKLGWRDVLLIEQGRLSGGTTWHAAGLVGQLRAHSSLSRLVRYSTELYARLEAETGLATGWKQCGSLAVARTPDRLTVLKRSASTAKAQAIACDIISAAEAGEKYPVMRTDDLAGAIWLPGDGKANPADVTQALAKGARMGGATIIEQTRLLDFVIADNRVTQVRTDRGDVSCEIVVNCAGQWARAVGAKAGVTVPLHSCEHMYIVTERIAGVHRDLPVMRDPDGYIYFKEEVGGLLMGGFEPQAKPWGMDGIPYPFEFGLLPDDWDQFSILMENAIQRVPALETVGVKQFINGPESFTPDNNFILGEALEREKFFVGAGFNSMGIASAGGAGRALAEWIVGGEPSLDLWPVDIRRFAGFNRNPTWLRDRVSETLSIHYLMPWPNRELASARPFRRSPLYDRLKAKNAFFGSKMGWERPNVFFPPGENPEPVYSFGRQNWFEYSAAEHRAARERVALFDMTSFGKLLIQGKDAAATLQRLCCNDINVAPGRTIYTGLLNARGGYESDVTVARLDADKFMLVTGSAQPVRDADWINRHIPDDARCTLTDVTTAWTVLALMGPRARDLLQKISRADLSDAAFPFGAIREIDVGYATLLASRRTYVGELGWELFVPVEFAATVYDALQEAGAPFGLADAGYYAIESLRLEKAYRAWGRELSPDITPWQAGLGFSVALDKPGGFLGRDALAEKKAQPLDRRIVSFVAESGNTPLAHGGEVMLADGKPCGEVTSASYGHSVGGIVGLALVGAPGASADGAWLAARRFDIDIAGDVVPVRVSLRAPYDPANARIRA